MATRQEKYWLNHKFIDGEIYRKCSKCEKWLLENRDNFYYANKSKENYSYVGDCIECRKDNSTATFYNNIEREKERSQREDVKQMRNNIHKKWRKEHKEEWSEYYREYLHRPETKFKYKGYNEYRELNKSHDITKIEWINCKKYFRNEDNEYCCAYCGKPISQNYRRYAGELKLTDLHKEHVCHNGENDLSNCIPACYDCNCSKWTFSMEEWYKEQSFFSKDRLDKIHKWLSEDYKIHIESKDKYINIENTKLKEIN